MRGNVQIRIVLLVICLHCAFINDKEDNTKLQELWESNVSYWGNHCKYVDWSAQRVANGYNTT